MRYRHWETCPCCYEGPRASWSRRKFLAAAGAAALGLSTARFASAEEIAAIPYESVPDLLHLPPDLYLGEVSGVALNSKGHIFVLLARQLDRPGLRRGGGAAARVRRRWRIICARSATTSMPGRSRTR